MIHADQADVRSSDAGTEAIALSIMKAVADHPGKMGRLRCARIVAGYAVPYRDDEERAAMSAYAVATGWKLREIVQLVDAMINGCLLAHTAPPRPALCITRAGFRALTALESTSSEEF